MFIPPHKQDAGYQKLTSDDSENAGSDAAPPPSFAEAVGSSSRIGPADVINGQLVIHDGTEMDSMPPPSFTPYAAEYYHLGNGDIVSHDPHLNQDGEALYRFLLTKAYQKPELMLHCRGTHPEHRTRQVTERRNGSTTTRTENYTETVVDFDFYIDASSAILSGEQDTAVIWTVGDLDPAYRGKMVREVDNSPFKPEDIEAGDVRSAVVHHPTSLLAQWKHNRRKATKQERAAGATWRQRRTDWGYPPWVRVRGQATGTQGAVESAEDRSHLHGGLTSIDEGWCNGDAIQVPSKTLREWADEYCASNKILKEFTFQKTLYGWNMEALTLAVKDSIKLSDQHDYTVDFSVNGSQIAVRPDSKLSRALSKWWVRVFLWITLIFPLFIWPFKRFHRRGGGEWRVCGSSFALAKWKHLEDSIPGETVDEYLARSHTSTTDLIQINPTSEKGGSQMALANKPLASSSSRAPVDPIQPEIKKRVLQVTERGISEMMGTREGEWFRQWEDTIVSLASTRYQSTEPVRYPRGGARYRSPGIRLAGYL